ncbi:hypothetical protein [Hyphomicrobium sp. DY-1]|uniref:hypothetical protein n=1 Tax=Hyphomicrobium sp. DY-1 TaxID=3075650 RepID=UPI0039C0A248
MTPQMCTVHIFRDTEHRADKLFTRFSPQIPALSQRTDDSDPSNARMTRATSLPLPQAFPLPMPGPPPNLPPKESNAVPRHRKPPRPAEFTAQGRSWYPRYARQIAFIVGESRDGSFWRVKLADLKSIIIFTKTAIQPCDSAQPLQIPHHGTRQPAEEDAHDSDPQHQHEQPHD